MKTFDFHKTKYGKELLIDCRKFSETKGFTRTTDPYKVTFYEIYFSTSGSAKFKLDLEEINVEPGTVLLLPPNKVRQWKPIGEKVDGYFLIFESEFIANFFQDALFIHRFHFFHNTITPSFVKLPKTQFEKLIQSLTEIQNEILSLREDSHHFLRSLFYYILIQLNRSYADLYNIKSELFQNNLALNFKKLLDENFRHKHSVDDYAELLNMSRTHLNKTIKKVFGKPVSEIIKERIITEAKRELLFSSKTAAEISYELNFSDPSNFLRFFKNQTGISTKQFKEQFSK